MIPIDASEPYAAYQRARELLAEMYVGKWRDAIPADLRHAVGLALFGHAPSAPPAPNDS